METTELRELLTPEALSLLDSLPPYSSTSDVMAMVSSLRKAGHSASLVASVLTQAKLRARAQKKFGEFASHLLFTEAGLEQASRLSVATVHASRFVRQGLSEVVDLGCGIGADSLAFAAAGLKVTAVERDEVTAAIASYNLAGFPEAQVVNADARSVDLPAGAGIFLDPARRSSEHSNTTRITNPDDYSPSLDFAFGCAATHPTGIKLGPGFDRDLIPEGWEAQWISHNGEVVEMGLWSGGLERPGIRRAALVFSEEGPQELTLDADSENAQVGELGTYLYEPDGAVIRARLIGHLARQIGAHMLDEHIAYMSSDALTPTPFATAFRVEQVLPLDPKAMSTALVGQEIGSLEIKKRGVDIDPAQFRKKLKLSGPNQATLFLTRIAEKRIAVVAKRV